MENLAICKKHDGIAKYKQTSAFLAMTPNKASVELRHVNSMKTLSLSVVHQETPSIMNLGKEVGVNKTIAFIALWLTDFFNDVNFKTPVTSRQIVKLSTLITRGFPNLTIADLSMFLEKVLLGNYIEFWNSELNIKNFNKGLKEFWKDRLYSISKLNVASYIKKNEELDKMEYCSPPKSVKSMISNINKNKK